MGRRKINLLSPPNPQLFVKKSTAIFNARANGKLLLTGEYAVLDGAEALAVPTVFGQQLAVFQKKDKAHPENQLTWQSFEPDGTCWFSVSYEFTDFNFEHTSDIPTAIRLAEIFREIRREKPDFLKKSVPIAVETRADFPRAWGLGTSSTLISLLSEWSGVDPFFLLEKTFGGSGYDIACARSEEPILFKNLGKKPVIEPIYFFPKFHNCLYFIYLGKKQDSRAGIHRYRELAGKNTDLVKKISHLTRSFLAADSLSALDGIIREHENLIAKTVDLPRAQTVFFEKFWGETKSLGAWGGDFVLATSDRGDEATARFFNGLGFPVIFRFEELVRHQIQLF